MGIAKRVSDFFVIKPDPSAVALYGACVDAARQPVFYARYGVPDTLDGRFDLLVLHVLLTILRLPDVGLKQRLFDHMFRDMDRSLREMGVGDMSIGKKMKPMLAGFYGRSGAYEAALAKSGDEKLAEVLSRNLFGMQDGLAEHAFDLARYMRLSVAHLAELKDDDLAVGRVSFPSMT